VEKVKSGLKKSEKKGASQTKPPRKRIKIRGKAVLLLWRAAAGGSLPLDQMEVHVHLKNVFPGGIGNRRIMFGYNPWFASHPSPEGRQAGRGVGGTGTRPDYLVNRVLTKNEGHVRKKLYSNREIVVK